MDNLYEIKPTSDSHSTCSKSKSIFASEKKTNKTSHIPGHSNNIFPLFSIWQSIPWLCILKDYSANKLHLASLRNQHNYFVKQNANIWSPMIYTQTVKCRKILRKIARKGGWNGNYSWEGIERAEHLCDKQHVLGNEKYSLNSSLSYID